MSKPNPFANTAHNCPHCGAFNNVRCGCAAARKERGEAPKPDHAEIMRRLNAIDLELPEPATIVF